MDAISYSYADKQAKRIKKFINNPDSTSGIVTVPKTIASGETITIPAGRVAVLPNVIVDGDLVVEAGGEIFVPAGANFSDLEGQIATKADTSYVNSKYSGFKNYIINGKKVVNQRVLTSTDNSYNQDRWYKVGNNWFQGIEGDNNLIRGKTYTLSWIGAATASYYVGTATSTTINAQTFTSIANGGSFTLTISAGQNLWIKFASDATGSTFNFVQLEEGSVATPFENRPYGLELSLCQRYYQTWLGFLDTYNQTGQQVRIAVPFRVSMRTVPTIVITSNTSINVSSVGASISGNQEFILTSISAATGHTTLSANGAASAEL